MSRSELDTAGFKVLMRRLVDAIPIGERRLIAIAGAPASGKSTLAAELEHESNELSPGSCAVVPMDGFHYDDELLNARGWRSRKGAPHTFDVGGLSATLGRLKLNDEKTVAVPRFDRSIEIARAGAILIERGVRLTIVEGNYLLLKDPPWDNLASFFDGTTLIVTELEELERRNRQRWEGIDMDEASIAAKLEENDLPNARLIYERSNEPDWIVRT